MLGSGCCFFVHFFWRVSVRALRFLVGLIQTEKMWVIVKECVLNLIWYDTHGIISVNGAFVMFVAVHCQDTACVSFSSNLHLFITIVSIHAPSRGDTQEEFQNTFSECVARLWNLILNSTFCSSIETILPFFHILLFPQTFVLFQFHFLLSPPPLLFLLYLETLSSFLSAWPKLLAFTGSLKLCHCTLVMLLAAFSSLLNFFFLPPSTLTNPSQELNHRVSTDYWEM